MDLRQNKALTPVDSGMPIDSITIDLTNRCNLACDYCFTHLYEGGYKCGTITEERAKSIVDWLMSPSTRGDSESVDITFWGGEPLLEWELLQKIVLYAEEKAKEHGIRVTFNGTTNVTLLTPEKFDFMDEHKLYFLLSIDGRKETHDRHRVFKDGRGSWDVIDKNVDAILERWPDTQVRLSYSVENIETFIEDIKYLYNKGFRRIAFSPVCEGDWTEEKLEALRKSMREVGEWYKEHYEENKEKEFYVKFINDACKRTLTPEGNHAPCGAGRGYIGITIDGAIYPCHRFHKFTDPRPWYEREVCLGHVDYGILNQEWRENFIKWDIYEDLPESCKQCAAFGTHCTGGCWATNWDLTGSLRENPRVCCEGVLVGIEVAEKLLKDLGEEFADKYKRRRPDNGLNVLPLVQGCQCYNVHDNLFGRETVNKNDRYRCLCNMATYGARPRKVTSCNCYNVENVEGGISHYDMTGAQCGRFTAEHQHQCQCKTKDPVQEAIEYLKKQNLEFEKLSESQKQQIDEFITLLETNKTYKEQIEAQGDIINKVE